MKLSLVEKNKTRTTFEVGGVSAAYVNSLRRVFSHGVPTMAISFVEFKQNSSALYDEMFAHRLGLVVLNTDLSSYNLPKEGVPEGPATHCTFSLKAIGPKVVLASDLKPSDPAVKPVYPDTVLVKLLEGQEVELVATAHLGFGSVHTKWSPGLISYYFKPVIKVNNKAPSFKESRDKFPKLVFNAKGEIDVSKINTPQLIDACGDIDSAVVDISYPGVQSEFVFSIEPWGQLSVETIVEEGVKQFNVELDEFKKLFKGV